MKCHQGALRCPVCDKTFQRQMVLEEHMTSHFKQVTNLNILHTGQKLYNLQKIATFVVNKPQTPTKQHIKNIRKAK